MTDANGNVTRYYYDLNDRKIREVRPSVAGTSPALRVQDYFYDSSDHLVREVTHAATGGADRVTSYQYDVRGRLVRKRVSRVGSSEVVEDDSSFTYEPQQDASLMQSAVNGVANVTFTHEAAPAFADTGFSVVSSQAGNPLSLIEGNFGMPRDTTGKIASISKDGNYVFQKGYDPAGRMLTGTMGGGTTSLSYDGFGRKIGVQHPDGSTGNFQYDLLIRLTSVGWTGSTPISESLAYDTAGNITQLARESGGAWNVAYDAVNQIIGSTGIENRSWQLDQLGNRLQDSANGAGSFINNFLTSNGVATYTADPDGFGDTIREVKGGVTKNYIYRADDRLAGYSDGTNQVAYYYDGLGRLAAKAITDANGSYTQSFAYLGAEDRLLMSKAGDGTITTYMDGNGKGEHLAKFKSGVYKGYVTDHVGSILNTDAAGSSHRYSLFGAPSGAAPLSRSSDPASFAFAGGMLDRASGNTRFGLRDLNHDTGRWLSMEMLGLGGPNGYTYVGNNPMYFVDLTGLIEESPYGDGETARSDAEFQRGYNNNMANQQASYSNGGPGQAADDPAGDVVLGAAAGLASGVVRSVVCEGGEGILGNEIGGIGKNLGRGVRGRVARQAEQRQVNEIARRFGLDRDAFGRYIEELKTSAGKPGDANFTYEELQELAKEFGKIGRP